VDVAKGADQDEVDELNRITSFLNAHTYDGIVFVDFSIVLQPEDKWLARSADLRHAARLAKVFKKHYVQTQSPPLIVCFGKRPAGDNTITPEALAKIGKCYVIIGNHRRIAFGILQEIDPNEPKWKRIRCHVIFCSDTPDNRAILQEIGRLDNVNHMTHRDTSFAEVLLGMHVDVLEHKKQASWRSKDIGADEVVSESTEWAAFDNIELTSAVKSSLLRTWQVGWGALYPLGALKQMATLCHWPAAVWTPLQKLLLQKMDGGDAEPTLREMVESSGRKRSAKGQPKQQKSIPAIRTVSTLTPLMGLKPPVQIDLINQILRGTLELGKLPNKAKRLKVEVAMKKAMSGYIVSLTGDSRPLIPWAECTSLFPTVACQDYIERWLDTCLDHKKPGPGIDLPPRFRNNTLDTLTALHKAHVEDRRQLEVFRL
jgi:hypothetical protein